ncbi:MAG: GspH/FimT family pseudopilin [Steroidobacteraceae bacterium]
MNKRIAGFTLMELMIVLALAAVILSIGAPSFAEFRRNNRLTGAGNELLGAMQTARSEAIKRQVPVAVCPSNDPGDAGATCSAGAFTGWIVFVDPDNNCVRDTANPREVVLRVGDTIDPALTVRSTGICASFAGNGFLQDDVPSAADVAGNTIFCDDRGKALQAGTNLSSARGVDVSATGRSRVTREPAEINAWLACP